MFKSLIRTLSFFAKEINEVRRQPRLVLSLLMGPFLILLLFGVGYRGGQPSLRTAIVLPEGEQSVSEEYLRELTGANFELISVGSNRDEAMALLGANAVDVVQVFPSDLEERVLRGEQGSVEFVSNEIDPFTEQWIQYLAYAEVSEINRQILVSNAGTMQGEAADASTQLAEVRTRLDTVLMGTSDVDQAELQESVRRLKQVSGALAVSALITRGSVGGVDGERTREQLIALQGDLDALDEAIVAGNLESERERMQIMRDRIAELEGTTALMSQLPPTVIVSPLAESYQNLNGAAFAPMVFYAPSVLAMLVQHIAVTLGSLSLVRERLLGATEVFQVAPVNLWQILIGKYLGYALFIGLITAALVGLMIPLGIPLLGSPLVFAGVVLLLTVASIGIGFLISSLSRSESQAVQLSMLGLLMSVFFSGFFLPLQNFWAPVRAVGQILPLTHGINALQDLMLRGAPPELLTWLALGIITLVTFCATLFIEGRQFYR